MFQNRVYIAEEDKAIRKELSAALQRSGFDVHVFDSGYPLVKMMDNWPDAFLIDIELPDVNGLEVCKWLKSHEDSRNIPVILIAGETYLKVLVPYAHADDYLKKPVSAKDVVAKVRAYLLAETSHDNS